MPVNRLENRSFSSVATKIGPCFWSVGAASSATQNAAPQPISQTAAATVTAQLYCLISKSTFSCRQALVSRNIVKDARLATYFSDATLQAPHNSLAKIFVKR